MSLQQEQAAQSEKEARERFAHLERICEEFHTKYDAKIQIVIEGAESVSSIPSLDKLETRGSTGYLGLSDGDSYHFAEMSESKKEANTAAISRSLIDDLTLLLSAVNPHQPKGIEFYYAGNDPLIKNIKRLFFTYEYGDEFIQWVRERYLENYKQAALTVANGEKDISKLSQGNQKIVRGYLALEDLLTEWSKAVNPGSPRPLSYLRTLDDALCKGAIDHTLNAATIAGAAAEKTGQRVQLQLDALRASASHADMINSRRVVGPHSFEK